MKINYDSQCNAMNSNVMKRNGIKWYGNDSNTYSETENR